MERMHEKTRSNGRFHPQRLGFDHPELAQDDWTIDELRQEVIDSGIDLSQVRHQENISRRRDRAQKLALKQQRVIPFFRWLRTGVSFVGYSLMLFLDLAVEYIGPSAVVVGLAYAETNRVNEGIALFAPEYSGVLSVVAVGSFISLLLIRAKEARDYQKERWSMRLVLRRLGYLLGVTRDWKSEYQTHDQLLHNAIRWSMWFLVLLATLSSLQPIFEQVENLTWYRGLGALITESNLTDFFSLVGGALLSLTLLSGLDFIIEHLTRKVAVVLPEDQSLVFICGGNSEDLEEAAEKAERDYLLSLLKKQR